MSPAGFIDANDPSTLTYLNATRASLSHFSVASGTPYRGLHAQPPVPGHLFTSSRKAMERMEWSRT